MKLRYLKLPGLTVAIMAAVGGLLLAQVRYTRNRQRRLWRQNPPESLILRPELEQDRAGDFARLIPLEGGVNFRDIGGYANRQGQRVRWGQVYRSGSLALLTPADLDKLQALNIRLICDLRHSMEISDSPDRVPSGAVYRHVPVQTGDNSRRRMRAMILQPALLNTIMLETYAQWMIDQNAAVFGGILQAMTEPDGLPMVVHCTAGKDRTGITIMLLLLLLDVPEEVILADYSLSNRHYRHYQQHAGVMLRRVQWTGLQPEDMYPMLVADPKLLKATIDYLHTRYGSAERYLLAAGGMTPDGIARLRERLLEPV